MRVCSDVRALDLPALRDATAVRARGGFVLLEALIALAIVGIMVVSLLAATSGQLRTAGKAATMLTARSLAEERMAVLRSLEYNALVDPPDSLLAGVFGEPFERYAWRSEIAPVEGEYDLFSAAVVVTVEDDELTLRTLLHEPQPQLSAGAAQQGGR